MKIQNLTLQQLKEIVDGAPTVPYQLGYFEPDTGRYLKLVNTRSEFSQTTHSDLVVWTGKGWTDLQLIYSLARLKSLLKLSDIHARINELEPKQKYDWSNVPDVVNWLATDKDGDCAWGFLEEPVIELEDEEWRPVAPYTEIYINGSNGTVAAHKGDWRESLEQRKFKIGDKVTFIRNIEPFQWGAKAKVYEVVDVADNLPTSTDQRVWLDTTASSPHLSRNLCLATAIGQVGIEDLPIHGEPISSEIITNVPVIDELEAADKVDPALPYDESNDFDAMSEKHRSPSCKCHEFPFDAELNPDPFQQAKDKQHKEISQGKCGEFMAGYDRGFLTAWNEREDQVQFEMQKNRQLQERINELERRNRAFLEKNVDLERSCKMQHAEWSHMKQLLDKARKGDQAK